MGGLQLDEKALRLVGQYSASIDQVIGMLASGRLKRTSVRLRLKQPRTNPGRLAKHCGRENRRVCEQAIKWLLHFFTESSIEEAIKWGLSIGVAPEVTIAYLTAFTRLVTEDPRQWSSELRESLSKVVIDYSRMSLVLEPLRGSFTVTDARNVITSLRLKG